MKSKTLFAHYTKRNLLLQYLFVSDNSPQKRPVRIPPAPPRAPPVPLVFHGAVPWRFLAWSHGAVPWRFLACLMVRSRVSHGAVPWRFLAYPVVRSRGGRARCPHRAAAPSARCVALHPAPRARASPRPIAHASPLAVSAPPPHPHITRAARWGHRALPPLHPRISHAYYPHDAMRGLESRAPRLCATPAALAPRCRVPRSCPVAALNARVPWR